MTEKELDAILCRRLKACISTRALPEGFAGRLKVSIRRSRRALRLRIALATALSVVLGMTLCGISSSPSRNAPEEFTITAEHDKQPAEKVSGWMLLGFLRDCFRRSRTGKRKEED